MELSVQFGFAESTVQRRKAAPGASAKRRRSDVDLGRYAQLGRAEEATNGHLYHPDYDGPMNPIEHFFGTRFNRAIASPELNEWHERSGEKPIRHYGVEHEDG